MQKLLLPNLFQNDNLVKVVNFSRDKEPFASLTVIASQIKKIN